MNKNDLIKKLEDLDLPEVELPGHQRRLKMALLTSDYFKKQTTMTLIKRFAPIGAVAVITLFVVIGVNYSKNPSLVDEQSSGLLEEPLGDSSPITRILDGISPKQAWAKEIIEKSTEVVRTADALPSLAVTKRVGGATEVSVTVSKDDYLNFLKEARQSKDLAYIGDKVLPDGKKVRVLLYTLDYSETNTSPQYAALLGIDDDDIPVVRIVYDTKTMGGVMFEKGPSNGKSVEEMMNFWTDNLENQPQEQQEQTDFKTIQK